MYICNYDKNFELIFNRRVVGFLKMGAYSLPREILKNTLL